MIGNGLSLVSLSALSRNKQHAFALLIIERMLPHLIAFSKDTGRDDSCYLNAKNAAWAALENDAVEPGLYEACLSNAPDTEEFSHEFTSYALDAALAISEILKFTMDGGQDHLDYILTLVHDSLDLYLSSLEPSLVSTVEKYNRNAQHPLMQQEQARQADDIKFLSALPDRFDKEVISALKARAGMQSPLLPLARGTRKPPSF